MSKFVTMHGGLKVSAEQAEKMGLDPRNLIAPQGSVVELDADFVKQVDPSGVQFVTEEQYDALVTRIEAQDAAEKAIAAKRGELETAAQKLASQRVNAKLVIAVRAIEAAKKAPKPAKVKTPPTVAEQAVEGDEPVKKPKKAPKPAKGA